MRPGPCTVVVVAMLAAFACGGDDGDGAPLAPAETRASSTAARSTSDVRTSAAQPRSTPIVTESTPPPTDPPTTPAPDPDPIDHLFGVLLIDAELEAAPWPLPSVPYLELARTTTSDGSDLVISGYDGCNWSSSIGRLDGDRFDFESRSRRQWDAARAGGRRHRLRADDNRAQLEVYNSDGALRLVLVRFDALAPQSATELHGSWSHLPDPASVITFDPNGTMSIGTCAWTWSFDTQLHVSGFPPDPRSCFGEAASST